MMSPHPQDNGSNPRQPLWLFTADAKQARLLRVSRTRHNRVHVDLEASLTEEWEEVQHGRPFARSGKLGHTYASEGHEDEERLHRFAKQVVAWLETQMDGHGIERLHAFAAPRFLGEMRGVLPQRLAERITERPLDLAPFSPGELAGHHAVLELEDGEKTDLTGDPA